MKITCHCGSTILDSADALPHKAHLIPDQEWLSLLEAIDGAIEQSGPSPREKEAACLRLRTRLSEISRQAWQCRDCGRVYVERADRQLEPLIPGSDDIPRELFRSRAATEPTV